MKKAILGIFVIPILVVCIFMLATLSHDHDMQRGCAEKGRFNGLLGEISCAPIEKE